MTILKLISYGFLPAVVVGKETVSEDITSQEKSHDKHFSARHNAYPCFLSIDMIFQTQLVLTVWAKRKSSIILDNTYTSIYDHITATFVQVYHIICNTFCAKVCFFS